MHQHVKLVTYILLMEYGTQNNRKRTQKTFIQIYIYTCRLNSWMESKFIKCAKKKEKNEKLATKKLRYFD